MSKNVDAWREYRGEDIPAFLDDALGRYRHTLAELEQIGASDPRRRSAKLITLTRLAEELQRLGAVALVDACYKAAAAGQSFRSIAREAGVSDVTVLRWVQEINDIENPFDQSSPRLNEAEFETDAVAAEEERA